MTVENDQITTIGAFRQLRQKVKLEKVFSPQQYLQFFVVVGFWVIANYIFWHWWLQPQNVATPILFVLISYSLFLQYDSIAVVLYFLSWSYAQT